MSDFTKPQQELKPFPQVDYAARLAKINEDLDRIHALGSAKSFASKADAYALELPVARTQTLRQAIKDYIRLSEKHQQVIISHLLALSPEDLATGQYRTLQHMEHNLHLLRVELEQRIFPTVPKGTTELPAVDYSGDCKEDVRDYLFIVASRLRSINKMKRLNKAQKQKVTREHTDAPPLGGCSP